MTLTFRRTISFIILLVMIMSSLSTSVFAADATAPTEAETVKPTEKPTEPPFTVETYGYQGYINKLEKLAYTKELGAVYSKKKTAFKLWSPVASSVKVNIYKTGSDQETGAQMLTSASMMEPLVRRRLQELLLHLSCEDRERVPRGGRSLRESGRRQRRPRYDHRSERD